MKTSNMTPWALALVLIPFLASAATGTGSGNGDGDGAFALQKAASENPGLKPYEVLLKAFEESSGRIPSLNFAIVVKDKDTKLECAEMVPGAISEGISISLANTQLGKEKFETPFIVLRIGGRGRLLGPGHMDVGQGVTCLQVAKNGGVKWSDSDSTQVVQKETGLFRKSGPEFGGYEFRSYSEDIVMYVEYAYRKDGTLSCGDEYQNDQGKCLKNKDCVARPALNNGICKIGYFWRD